MNLLKKKFLDLYPDQPEHMNELSSFVFYRTYSRWLNDKGRRETWKEAVARAVEFNMSLALKQFEKNNYVIPMDKVQKEAETLFDNIFNLRQFLSGRTHWVGGADTGIGNKFPLANFNCSFIEIKKWTDLCELFYLLLVGTGVGFKVTKSNIANLPPIRTDFELLHSEYKPVSKKERLENTRFNIMENGYAKIYIGDSKEGWVRALHYFLLLITNPDYDRIKHIKISYNSVRPKGERLKTFGGTASGHEPLKEMFDGFYKIIKNELDPLLAPMEKVDEIHAAARPIHIIDMCNLIGANVVVGGVRRTAEIALFDADDWECILAKYGINGIYDWDRHISIGEHLEKLNVKPTWWDNITKTSRISLNHRRMSNNSICFTEKPTREYLHTIFEIMQGEGEPGFTNLEAAQKRRPNVKGFNPCVEVLIDSRGVCNLTTVNVMSFVKPATDDKVATLDFQGLMQAQALSTRAAIRMTCIDLELPDWDKVHKRDRLTGVSLTGWKDAMSALGYTEEQEINLMKFLRDVAHDEALRYAHILRIPNPLLITTIKPEGTLSQIANGVSSGLHKSYAPYYIRRIRINAQDPLAKVAKDLGWIIHAEVGTPGETEEERLLNARTLVIDFPCKSETKSCANDQDVVEQFNTYFNFQRNYTDHNSSNTITVNPDEWSTCEEIVWNNWNEFIGVSFLAKDGGTYELAPYEEITKEQYEELKEKMQPFNPTLLLQYETSETETDIENMEACSLGVCPIR